MISLFYSFTSGANVYLCSPEYQAHHCIYVVSRKEEQKVCADRQFHCATASFSLFFLDKKQRRRKKKVYEKCIGSA